ncbi:MAG: APC family permease [Steroidobacteraceae bacterium]|jgi:amino acid transporter
MSLEEFGYRQELRRALTTKDLVVYGMVFMVPIAPFSVYGFVWDNARGMVPLAYLVGLVGMIFTALSYAAMSRAFPLAGSVYTYAGRGLHEAAGFFSGWLILLDYMLVPSLLYLFSAVALRPLLPAVPAWLWLGGFIAFNAAANMIGIEFTARLNRYMLVLELITLAAFVTMGLIALYHRGEGAGGLTWTPVYDPRVFSWATVSGATSIAVLSFLGFDGISTLSEENRGKENGVGRATVIALLLVGALFMLQTWVATDLARGMHFSSPETAFYDIADLAGGAWLKLLVIVAVVFASAIANAMAAQAAVARILFAMARDRKLPAVLAKVHPRFKTPYISTLAVAGVSVLVGCFFFQRIDDLTRVVNFGALSGFVLLHLSVINHFFLRQRSGDWLRHLAFPLIGLAIILYVLYEMDRAAKILGACWIVLGAVYYGALALRGRRLISAESGGNA